ncbi:MAG: hypothetical protein KDA21_04330 [Phycisphaerales bacterium]|nr:hypothetical protein [Phycisphaerales bacterium]
MMRFKPLQTVSTLAGLACAALAVTFGYRLLRAEVVSDIYRARLDTMAADYAALEDAYNRVVRRTAVTELVVEEGRLDVRVRNAAGEVSRHRTPYDPSGEIYVDYVVIDGRLWIRRIFDASTPPARGYLIDPALACIDWSAEGAAHGKAIYRSLEPGRWVISVSGNGALGLVPAEGEADDLVAAPEVRDYAELERRLKADADAVGLADVWNALTR